MSPLPIPDLPVRAARAITGKVGELLRHHPLPPRTRIRHSLIVTWAVPASAVQSWLLPGLELVTVERDGTTWGLVSCNVGELDGVQAATLPTAGTRVTLAHSLRCRVVGDAAPDASRGVQVLARLGTTRIAALAADLTSSEPHARVQAEVFRPADERGKAGPRARTAGPGELRFAVSGSDLASFDVTADLRSHGLPDGSVFTDLADARALAGPIRRAFFGHAGSVVAVEAHSDGKVEAPLVAVDVAAAGFLEAGSLAGVEKRLSSAFHLANTTVRWGTGVDQSMPERSTP